MFGAQKTIRSQIESIYMQIVEQIFLKLSEMKCHTGLSTLVHSYNLPTYSEVSCAIFGYSWHVNPINVTR